MIDRKKLKMAFRMMRRHGLFAEQNFGCCNDCWQKLCAEEQKSANHKGWTYYDDEGNRAMRKGGDLYIDYGTFLDPDVENDEDLRRIGHIVCSCLTLAGLQCCWDGDSSHQITVHNVSDKRAPRAKLKLVAGTGHAKQKGDNPEATTPRPDLRLVVNRPSSADPSQGSESDASAQSTPRRRNV